MSDPAEALATYALRAVAPLADSFEDPVQLEVLLREVGWRSSLSTEICQALRAAAGLGEALEVAAAALDQLARSADPGVAEILPVVEAAVTVLDKLRGLASLTGKVAGAPFDQPTFWGDLAQDLPPLLLAREIANSAPGLHAALAFVGIITYENVAASGFQRLPYRQVRIDWDALGGFVRNPGRHLAERYGWGGELQHDRLLRVLEEALVALGIPARRQPVAGPALRRFPAPPRDVRQLVVPLVEGAPVEGTGHLQVQLELTPVPASASGDASPRGLSLMPRLGAVGAADLPLGATLHLEVAGAADIEGGLEILAFPESASIEVDIPDAHLDVLVRLADRPAGPRTLIGSDGSHRIEVGAVWLSVRGAGDLVNGQVDDTEIVVEVGTEPNGVAVVLQFAQADGFLGSVFGDEPQRLELGGTLAWSSRTGLRLAGNVGLVVNIPLNASIGVVTLQSITAGIEATTDGARLLIALSGNLSIGPVAASVDQVGVSLVATPVAPDRSSGSLGDLDLRFGFKPPSGLGMSIDAGPVKGGGFVFFDPDREQYAGILHLEFADTIAVTAIALLTTRMPDGSKGFSLLVIVAASGFTPIQLGMGFTLSGIGGLVGINRSVDLAVLRPGLRSGMIDSILFPTDPVRNAPAIVSSLSAVFPPTRDHFVLGPMAILGWGTPNLVTLKLGLLIEAPSPTRLLLLGRLAIVLPSPEKAIVKIQLDALGVLDFDRGELSLDATLFDSRILTFALTGDMALRVGWGVEPQFLLAVGGFNPRYPTPAGFPPMRRLALELSSSENPRLRFEAYLAITSNTLQFGARAELFFAVSGFSLEGKFGFDALIQFVPFGFVIDIYAGLGVRYNGALLLSISAELTLSGPSPWRACGTASFTVLFLSFSVGFDMQIGPEIPPTRPEPVDVRVLLMAALADDRNWSSELPAQCPPLVALSDSGAGGTRVHPLARLSVRQQVVPLNRTITMYGTSLPAGERRFEVTVTAEDGGSWLVDAAPLREAFAPAQFDPLSDDEKLRSPAFVPMDAGLVFGTDELAWSPTAVRERNVAYETRLVDPAEGVDAPDALSNAAPSTLTGVVRNRMSTGVRP